MSEAVLPFGEREITALSFLVGGGEMGALMRAHDWTTTPLGPVETWPQSLRSAVSIMLNSRYPIALYWGHELALVYNDAWRPIPGGKHPWALGRPGREVWPEIWDTIGPLYERVFATGEGVWQEDELLPMNRHGYIEECYYNFTFSPVRGEDGRIDGIFNAVVETTDRVLSERRLRALSRMGQPADTTLPLEEACRWAINILAENAADVPFALVYVDVGDGDKARLVGAIGVTADTPVAPHTVSLSGDAATPWQLGAARQTGASMVVAPPAPLDLTGAVWPEPVTEIILVPIVMAGEARATAFLVAGANPRRRIDAGYRSFFELAAGNIGKAITTARAYEEERRRTEALTELNRAKTAFFSNVSHEFRTPLTLMLGPLEEVISGGLAAEQMREQVQLAHRNGTRLLRLVNSLLDFSRIEAGRVKATFEPVDLSSYSAEIASSFRSVVEKAGLALEIDAPPLPQPVFVDPEMWEKVLLNLLSNAFKFTLDGRITIRIEPNADGRSAKVSISDTGIGIPAEELPRLFERFHRVDGAQGRSFEGSGIGLALVNELVHMHAGDITAESAVGKGTTFVVTLPFGRDHLPADQVREQARTEATVASAHGYLEEALRWLPQPALGPEAEGDLLRPSFEATPTASDKPGHGKRVLLADDNADMRDYVTRLLEAQGYVVDAVADGEAAIVMARTALPDLLLTDVMMPKLDGFGLLEQIRSDPRTRSIPVIVLSARAGEEAKVEGLEAGADDYLIKPFAARELLARVNANIQMAAVRREADRAIWASEQRFRITQERLSIALSSSAVGVFEWEIDDDRVAVLGPIAALYGVDSAAAETAGLPLSTFIAGIHSQDRERVQREIAAAIAEHRHFHAAYRVVGSGSEREVIAFGDLHNRDESSRLLAGVIIDVTDLHRSERELQALNTRLEERVTEEVAERIKAEEALRQAQKMEAVGQLTGGVAHDFNNLLTIIIGGLETIRRCHAGDEARMKRATDMALQGAQRAAGLTGRLLAFSRRQPLDPKPLDLNIMVRDITELLHRTLGEQVDLEGVLAPRLWTVEVDKNQLENAMLNLAVNARDAMPDGGKLTIETANTELDDRYAAQDSEVIPGQYVMISISDSGAGMSKETLSQAFDPFFTTKEVGRGTGLGLSMVYGFVKQSNGHVTIYSEEGHGTTVKLYFPRHHAVAVAEPVVERTPVPRGSHGEVVLVVEDDEDVRAYSVQVLEELGYEVLQAIDAEHALPILRSQQRIDLLFTDVVLPGKSGRLIADEARDLRPGLKVLFATGYSRNAIVHNGRLDAGVQLISKPFTFEQLAGRVRDLLDAQ